MFVDGLGWLIATRRHTHRMSDDLVSDALSRNGDNVDSLVTRRAAKLITRANIARTGLYFTFTTHYDYSCHKHTRKQHAQNSDESRVVKVVVVSLQRLRNGQRRSLDVLIFLRLLDALKHTTITDAIVLKHLLRKYIVSYAIGKNTDGDE